MKKIFFSAIVVPFLLASFAAPVWAADPPAQGPGNTTVDASFKIKNPFKVGDNLFTLLEAIIKNIILPIGGMLCVLAFIWAGFKFVTAQGNQTKITNAKNTLLYAAIGTAILLGALTIQVLIRTTFTQLLTP